jgi:flagellar motor switch protein FliG
MDNEQVGGVFLNGKAQILEMMPLLSPIERNKLIKNIRMKNPQLADELVENSITFKNILDLNDDTIQVILRYVKAPILGVALKSLTPDDQRKILCLCEREYAEQAYKAMRARLSREIQDIEKACLRVKSVMGALVRKGYIKIS